MSSISMIILSLLFGLYSIYVTSYPLSADRKNYAMRFNWENPWTYGLNTVANFLHFFTSEPESLFFTVSFLCALLTFIAYRISSDGDRYSMLLVLCSDYLIFSFAGLKQALAMAFGTIAIILFLKKQRFKCAILTVIAIMFHETAFILPLVYLVLFESKNKFFKLLSWIMMIGFIVGFSPFSRMLVQAIAQISPNAVGEVASYIDDTNAIITSYNSLVFLKGLPIYLLTIFGLYKRKELLSQITHYDEYLMMSYIASFSWIISSYSYWIKRFSLYFYVPLFIFASELRRVNKNKKEATMFSTILVLVTAAITLRYLFQIFFKYGGF